MVLKCVDTDSELGTILRILYTIFSTILYNTMIYYIITYPTVLCHTELRRAHTRGL